MNPLIQVKNLRKEYVLNNGKVLTALRDVSFHIEEGETLGLVGESGGGKSTIGRCLLRLEEPTKGEILIKGKNLLKFTPEELFRYRRQAQMIYQDPYSALNPRMNIENLIAEPLRIHKLYSAEQVFKLLDLVGLSRSIGRRYPHELSGGQRQRIVIARALALHPQIMICDEPICGLDVSIQAQIVNLLKNLQKEFNLTYLFITHDLAMAKYLSDRVAVMYFGSLVEIATVEELYHNPLHPYTRALLAAVPAPDPRIKMECQQNVLEGELPNPFKIIQGCPFVSRCPKAQTLCGSSKPALEEKTKGHFAACHF